MKSEETRPPVRRWIRHCHYSSLKFPECPARVMIRARELASGAAPTAMTVMTSRSHAVGGRFESYSGSAGLCRASSATERAAVGRRQRAPRSQVFDDALLISTGTVSDMRSVRRMCRTSLALRCRGIIAMRAKTVRPPATICVTSLKTTAQLSAENALRLVHTAATERN